MKKFAILFTALSLASAYGAHAQTESMQFPVQELGGCANKDACRQFCDNPVNRDACTAFAKTHDLVSPEQQRQIDQRQKLLELIQTNGGPGGCKTEADCKAFCSNPVNAAECKAFAEKIGQLHRGNASSTMPKMPPQPGQLKGPGGCASESDCHTYCVNHIDECVKFAMANIHNCQMPKPLPPGLHNNPNGIPDNFRDQRDFHSGSSTGASTTRPLPPPKLQPTTAGPAAYDPAMRGSFLSNVLHALFGR